MRKKTQKETNQKNNNQKEESVISLQNVTIITTNK